ncbi:MAG: aminotransferase class V-fold PLP-dependent enzyme [Planctomycetota bacterium]
MPTTLDISTVRADFPLLDSTIHGRPLVYLDNAATTQKPRAVLDRLMAFYRESYSNVHRAVHTLSEEATEAYEGARETVRQFINARAVEETIFTHGTTEGINMVADCFDRQWVQPGDRIILTEMEHHSNLVPWQMLCQRSGAELKVIPFADDGSLQSEQLASLLTDRTRLVAMSWVSNVLGTVNPVRQLIEAAHQRDVPVLIDAAQAAPRMPIDVQELDCEFLAFSGHKMYAETGIGVLYGKREWLERMQPTRYGGGMVRSVDWGRTSFEEPAQKFEAGTPNIAGAVSLDAAIRYLEEIGMGAIYEHEQELMRTAMERLGAIDGVRIYGTTPTKCGALSFTLEGGGAYDVAAILDKLGVAVRSGTHCGEPVMRHYGIGGTVRASFALYNTIAEIDALTEGVQRARAMLL